jgi:hypothetical protein
MVPTEQRIRSIIYNNAPLMRGYATYFYDDDTKMGITIDGVQGPYTLTITPHIGDNNDSGIALNFTGLDGQSRDVILPKDDYLPRIIERIGLIDDYVAHVISGPESEAERIDKDKSAHHDISANELEKLLLASGIHMEGPRKPEMVEGQTQCASEAARHIFGAVTDGMTDMLKRINPALGRGRTTDNPA